MQHLEFGLGYGTLAFVCDPSLQQPWQQPYFEFSGLVTKALEQQCYVRDMKEAQ